VSQIPAALFTSELFDLFEETFVQVDGHYLDRGTSLFETLDTISAEVASRPIGATCATIAAQVAHVRFYIDHLGQFMAGNDPGKADWGEIWSTISAVTTDEWDASRASLRDSYQNTRTLMTGFTTWEGEDDIGGALSVLVHTAYHLGEIRQALCTVT